MRKLRLVVARAPGAVSVLLTAGLVSCGSKSGLFDSSSVDGGGGVGGSGGVSIGGSGGVSTGGSGGGGGISLGGFGGTGGEGGTIDGCPPFSHVETYTVEVPPAGVLAIPGQICAVSTEPVASNTAARVTLTKLPTSIQQAQGAVVIGPGLEPVIAGVPVLTVIDSTIPELKEMQVSNLLPVPGGFTFDATWPNPLFVMPDGFARMTVQFAFDIVCDATTGETRNVTSITNIHLCLGDEQEIEWASSGDECTVCEIIAEMAPSPIVPGAASDDLPLAHALRLRLIPLARVGKSLVLLAENDGGDECEYAWHPSSGTLEAIEPDVVLWTPADDDAFIQAAVATPRAMAVASYSLREAS